MRSICDNAGHEPISARTGSISGRRSRHAQASKSSSISHRLIAVAMALPAAPIAGLPRCPYTKIQLNAAFDRFATITVHTIGATRCMACRLCRSTTNTRYGATPAIEIRKYVDASPTISPGCRSVVNTVGAGAMHRAQKTQNPAAMISPRCIARATDSVSPAPTACATIGSSAMRLPVARIVTLK